MTGSSESELQITIRAVVGNTQQVLASVKSAMQGLGVQAQQTGQSHAQLSGHVDRAAESFAKFGVKIVGVLAGYVAFSQSARMVADIFRGTVTEIDTLAKSATNLAMILNTLQKPGGLTFAQDLQYADATMDSLRKKAAELGVLFKYVDMTVRDFADVGIFPRSEQDLNAIAQISRYAQAIAVTRREGVGAEMQLKQLIEGQVSPTNQIAAIMMANLGVNKEQLVTLLRQAQAHNDMIGFIQRGLHMNQDALSAANNLISVQTGLLKDNVATIEIMAGQGLWGSIVGGLKEMNAFIAKNAADIASALTPALDSIGASLKGTIEDVIARWPEIQKQLTDAVRVAQELFDVFRGGVNAVIDVGTAIENYIIEPLRGAVNWAADLARTLQGIPNATAFNQQGRQFGDTSNRPHTIGKGTQLEQLQHAFGAGSAVAGATSLADIIGALTGQTPAPGETRKPPIGTQGHATGGVSPYAERLNAIRDAVAEEEAAAQVTDNQIQLQQQLVVIHRQEAQAILAAAAAMGTVKERLQAAHEAALLNLQAAREEATVKRLMLADAVELAKINAKGAQQEERDAEAAKRRGEEVLKYLQERKKVELAEQTGVLTKGVTDQLTVAEQAARGALAGIGTGPDQRNERVAIMQQLLATEQLLLQQAQEYEAAASGDVASTTRWQAEVDRLKLKVTELGTAIQKVLTEDATKATQQFVQAFQSGVAGALDNILLQGKSFGDEMVNLFRSIGTSVVKEFTQQLAQGLSNALGVHAAATQLANSISSVLGGLFGGGGATGSLMMRGTGGLFPGHFTPIRAFAGGGVAGGPMLGLVGEAGPEAVVPLKGGKIPVDLGNGGGEMHIHLHAWDTQTGMDALYQHRDFLYDLMGEGRRMNDGAMR